MHILTLEQCNSRPVNLVDHGNCCEMKSYYENTDLEANTCKYLQFYIHTSASIQPGADLPWSALPTYPDCPLPPPHPPALWVKYCYVYVYPSGQHGSSPDLSSDMSGSGEAVVEVLASASSPSTEAGGIAVVPASDSVGAIEGITFVCWTKFNGRIPLSS